MLSVVAGSHVLCRSRAHCGRSHASRRCAVCLRKSAARQHGQPAAALFGSSFTRRATSQPTGCCETRPPCQWWRAGGRCAWRGEGKRETVRVQAVAVAPHTPCVTPVSSAHPLGVSAPPTRALMATLGDLARLQAKLRELSLVVEDILANWRTAQERSVLSPTSNKSRRALPMRGRVASAAAAACSSRCRTRVSATFARRWMMMLRWFADS